jgi:hypothetical protein
MSFASILLGAIGDTTENVKTRLPIYLRQFRPPGLFPFFNRIQGNYQ